MRLRSGGRAGLAVIAALVMGSAVAACSSSAATPGPTPTPWPSVIDLPTQLPASPTYEQVLPLFAYQGDRPFDVVENSTKEDDGLTVKDIAFIGAGGESVQALLVLPAGDGPFAAILYEHVMNGGRTQFLSEAKALAKQDHIVGLLVTRPKSGVAAGDLTETALQVREIRRALDLLVSQPKVDPTRLGYLGHSQGAGYGLVAASVDARFRAAVLMTPVPSVTLGLFAPHCAAGSTLIQYGKLDSLYTADQGTPSQTSCRVASRCPGMTPAMDSTPPP